MLVGRILLNLVAIETSQSVEIPINGLYYVLGIQRTLNAQGFERVFLEYLRNDTSEVKYAILDVVVFPHPGTSRIQEVPSLMDEEDDSRHLGSTGGHIIFLREVRSTPRKAEEQSPQPSTT